MSIFLTHFLNIEFMEECAFNEQWFLRFGMVIYFVCDYVYQMFSSLVKDED